MRKWEVSTLKKGLMKKYPAGKSGLWSDDQVEEPFLPMERRCIKAQIFFDASEEVDKDKAKYKVGGPSIDWKRETDY